MNRRQRSQTLSGTRAIGFASLALCLVLGACDSKQSPPTDDAKSKAQPEASPEVEVAEVEPGNPKQQPMVDKKGGFALFWKGGSVWKYTVPPEQTPVAVPADGLWIEEDGLVGPSSDGVWLSVVDVTNDTANPQDFTVWMEWKGAEHHKVSKSIAARGREQFELSIKKLDPGDGSDDAQWHVKAGDDPVVKIKYRFPVKPVDAT